MLKEKFQEREKEFSELTKRDVLESVGLNEIKELEAILNDSAECKDQPSAEEYVAFFRKVMEEIEE